MVEKEYLKDGLRFFNAILYDACGNMYFYETYTRTARTMNKIWSLHFYDKHDQKPNTKTCNYSIVNLDSSESLAFQDKDEYDFAEVWNYLNNGGWQWCGATEHKQQQLEMNDDVYVDYAYAQTLERRTGVEILWNPVHVDHWVPNFEILFPLKEDKE